MCERLYRFVLDSDGREMTDDGPRRETADCVSGWDTIGRVVFLSFFHVMGDYQVEKDLAVFVRNFAPCRDFFFLPRVGSGNVVWVNGIGRVEAVKNV